MVVWAELDQATDVCEVALVVVWAELDQATDVCEVVLAVVSEAYPLLPCSFEAVAVS